MTRPRVRRPLVLALALAPILAAAPARSAPGEDASAMLADVSPAVVTVHTEKRQGNTQGSGFIVDPGGVIVTAHHVIAGALRVHVVLPTGAQLEVSGVVAADPTHDIALLRVTPRDSLHAVTLGNSDAVRRGDRVFVLASPQGLELTATDGIVSAPVRQLPGGRSSLQMTAPVFAGSSGGPVLSAQGEVVGMARSFHRDAQSLTFATPINVVKPLLAATSGAVLPFPPPEAAAP